MKINLDQLSQRCQKNAAPGYWLAGDEILLQQESAGIVRAHAKQAGFTERNVFHVDAQFNWAQLQTQQDNLSLFSDKQLIELHLTSVKLGDAGRKCLQACVETLNEETFLLILSPKVEAQTQKAKWFQSTIKILDFAPIWPITPAHYPTWLKKRCQQYQLNLDSGALNFLAQQTQGNLLAADQALQHLKLLHTNETVNQAALAEILQQSQQTDLFTLADTALTGNLQQALTLLHTLKAQSTEPILILWALVRELRQLNKLFVLISQGQSAAQAMQSERIWTNKQNIMRNALKRLTQTQIQHLIQLAAKIDLQLKGIKPQDPWQNLEKFILALASPTT